MRHGGYRHGMRKLTKATLFQWGEFTSAAGLDLMWKIQCDGLSANDWECIANVMARKMRPFETVHGVPRGGIPFAAALAPHCRPGGMVLLADDVWTTGKSMTAFAHSLGEQDWIGVVAFARGDLPGNVIAFAEIISET